ncbi:uncharacterized protein LOC129757211 [Uranotaenia lowii]|uniref:uncharacterized protein LOC129757211 n=1 Tax=Uranotaenia lowii TaxID=190385 RepID=UPI00247958AA|nr:uncharacterized protein LOC129757211 [Uranotaenia lowii]
MLRRRHQVVYLVLSIAFCALLSVTATICPQCDGSEGCRLPTNITCTDQNAQAMFLKLQTILPSLPNTIIRNGTYGCVSIDYQSEIRPSIVTRGCLFPANPNICDQPLIDDYHTHYWCFFMYSSETTVTSAPPTTPIPPNNGDNGGASTLKLGFGLLIGCWTLAMILSLN